jgi:hypothetical protein
LRERSPIVGADLADAGNPFGRHQRYEHPLAVAVRFAIESLNATFAEERFLESAWGDTASLESAFVVEQLGRGRACHADASPYENEADLEEVGVEVAATLGDVSVGIAQEWQRGVERRIARDFGHG